MQLSVEIETRDNMLVFDILEVPKTTKGMEKQLAPNFSVTYNGTLVRMTADIPDIINLTLTIGSQIAIGLAANWLYDKLKGRAVKVKIERTEVRLEKEEIVRILTEKIEKTKG